MSDFILTSKKKARNEELEHEVDKLHGFLTKTPPVDLTEVVKRLEADIMRKEKKIKGLTAVISEVSTRNAEQ
jgi:hypothetical protein